MSSKEANQLIGRIVPNEWPARLPDLSPLDLFLYYMFTWNI